MKNKCFSTCLVAFTLSVFVLFFSKIDSNDWMKSLTPKYQSFISRFKQIGKP